MKMNSSVLERVYKMERKNNIHYASKNGSLYGGLKIAYFVFFAYAVFFSLVVAFGYLLMCSSDGTLDKNINTIVTAFAILALLIAGVVFNALRMPIIMTTFTLPAAVIGVVTFAPLLPEPMGMFGYAAKFYWAHLLPLSALLILSVWMLIIAVREKRILTREYRSITESLYKKYSAQCENLSDEQWEEFLNNYNPNDAYLQFKKQTEPEE